MGFDFFFADHENCKADRIGESKGKTIKFVRLAWGPLVEVAKIDALFLGFP